MIIWSVYVLVKIVYYKSLLCPRCIPTNKMLKAFQQRYPDVEIEEVEIIAHPGRARAAGIRQVPTIVVGTQHIHRAVPLEEFASWVFAETPTGQ
jgi:predicted DsbA family dithiol-disulfide isomerase